MKELWLQFLGFDRSRRNLRHSASWPTGSLFPVCHSPFSVGAYLLNAEPDNADLQLNGLGVSKKHAELRWNPKDEEWQIKDLGSDNGVVLEGSGRLLNLHIVSDGDIYIFGVMRLKAILGVSLDLRLQEFLCCEP